MSRAARRGRGVVAVVASVVVAALLGAGCATGRNGLGTSSSSCFQALPVASAAVHDRGRFVGVRSVSRPTAQALLAGPTDVTLSPEDTAEPAGAGTGTTAVTEASRRRACLVAFKGTYPRNSVDGESTLSRDGGAFAIVAVGLRDHRRIGAVVVDHLPFRFQHL